MDFSISELVEDAGAIVSVIAGIGIALLLPLYLSQRRDLQRLVEWMDREPGHPAADVIASEALLDRAEAELEELLGEAPGAAPAPRTEITPPPSPAAAPRDVPVTAAQRVTAERPALERITMERAALQPHPRWRRFVGTITRPRWLVAIAVAAVVLGIAAIFGSELLLETGDEGGREPKAAVATADVTVAVLNGTAVPGLGAKVGDDVEANDFKLGAVSTIPQPFDQTVVMFEKGQERAARKLARDLGVSPVQPIDRQAQRLSDGADLVVIAGQDRANA
jgi:LytR cell envelope-related transcriptional attenuator